MIPQRKNPQEEGNFIVRTYKEHDEDQIVEMHPTMRAINRDRSLGLEYWTWKNRLSPYFDPSLIIVADENGELIGCAHAQVRDLRISRSLIIKATQPADLYSKPEHRRRGIATEVTKVIRKNVRAKGAILLVGVTSPSTYTQFYSRREGDRAFTMPSHGYCKVAFTKKMNCDSVKRRASLVNDILNQNPEIRKKLDMVNLTVFFQVRGLPPFVLEVSQGSVSVNEGQPTRRPNMVITASKLPSAPSMLSLIRLFFSGGVKAKGLLRNLTSVYKCARVLQKIKEHY